MAIRRPVKWDGSNIRDFTSSDVQSIVSETIRLYGNDPSVLLSVVSSGGNLGTLTDTRLQAGAGQTDATDFPTAAELEDVSVVTVNYSRINQSLDAVAVNRSNYSWPLYRSGGSLRAMSETDVYDTFIDPALTTLSGGEAGSNTAGTYTVSSSTSLTGATLVSAIPIFTDTRAEADAYTADGLPETKDQPTTITNYYLHRFNSQSIFFITQPISYQLGQTNGQIIPKVNFRNQLLSLVRYHMNQEVSYSFSTGTARGTVMTNTARSGSKYLTYQVSADDYRAQEIPDYNSTAGTINTYRLYINRT